jgi:uncharacterized protein with ATP-grasp and redox domains
MDIDSKCVDCIINKANFVINRYGSDEDKRLGLSKEVFKIISMSPKGDTPPYLNARVIRMLKSELNLGDIYCEIKKAYNTLLLSMEHEILNNIYDSEDKLLEALKYAMAGNFIDFGVRDNIEVVELLKIINSAPEQSIDAKEYENFIEDISSARKMVYIADNAGEIVFDKIFIKVIKEMNPDITIDIIVRGKPVYNDVTIIDAEEVGISSIGEIIENGTDIPGTQLDEINAKARAAIDGADFIIAKGQGNFETLIGCGKNIYYIFLCKCDLFIKRFKIERFRGVFISERNVKNMIKQSDSCEAVGL